ncbi:MAG TPA: peptidylprolyl isomerase [Ilumatobacteraceae bacterium]
MNRRRSAVPAIACGLIALSSIALSSCATFNQNNVAAKVGDHSLSAKEAERLAADGGRAATGDDLRAEISKWIRVTVLEATTGAPTAPTTTPADLDTRYAKAITSIAGDQARTLYASGVNGSPVICLAAITVATLDDANKVLATLKAGTPFADAARTNSTDAVIAQAGGIVKGGPNADQECLDPATVNPNVVAALKTTPVGEPIAADLSTFAAVLMLRPFDDLLPESQSKIATASVPQAQLDAIVDNANIYVDPRYGRWDATTGTVVTLTS